VHIKHLITIHQLYTQHKNINFWCRQFLFVQSDGVGGGIKERRAKSRETAMPWWEYVDNKCAAEGTSLIAVHHRGGNYKVYQKVQYRCSASSVMEQCRTKKSTFFSEAIQANIVALIFASVAIRWTLCYAVEITNMVLVLCKVCSFTPKLSLVRRVDVL